MECGADEASQKGMICPPGFPSCLPLPCFFSGTSGTLGQNSSVTRAVAWFKLSHSEWDNARFRWDTVGHFVPVAPFCAVLRKDAGGRFSRLDAAGSVNFGAKPISPAASMGGRNRAICWGRFGCLGSLGGRVLNMIKAYCPERRSQEIANHMQINWLQNKPHFDP